jgi:hypothetical protein
MEDNKPACVTCAYSGVDYRLECRIKPPSPNYKDYGRMFPIVKPDDWCSKYKAKPKPEAHEAHEDFQKVLDTWVDDDE